MSNLPQLTSSDNHTAAVTTILQREPQVQQISQVLAVQKVQQEHVEQPLSGSSLPKQKRVIKKIEKEQLKRYIKKQMPSIVKRSLQRVSGIPKLAQSENSSDNLERKPEKINEEIDKNRKIDAFNKNLTGFLQQISQESIKCPICVESMISPALSTCGHTFCWKCIDQSIQKSEKCPSCRFNIGFSETTFSPIINNIIKAKVSFKREQAVQFQKRQAQYQDWQEWRVINDEDVYNGAVINVRDREDKWRKAEIVKIYAKKKQNQSSKVVSALLVHFIGFHKNSNQIIELPSNRFASFHFFTGEERQKKSRFYLSPPSNMSEFVLEDQ